MAGWALALPALDVVATGSVVIDSGSTVAVNAPAKDLVLSWRLPDGALVQPGEVLLRFDTALVERQLRDRRRAADIARIEFARQNATRAGELASLMAEQRKLRADLAVTRAAIAIGEERDPQRIALLQAALDAARLNAAVTAREAERSAVERDQGRASAAAAEGASRSADAARRAIAAPELALQLDAQPPQTPLELAALRLKAEDLAIRLGLGGDGQEDANLGVGARIAATTAQQEADQVSRRIELERIESELRESERDVQDRTPLVGIEITAAGASTPVARVRFAPGGRAVPEGWSADHGAVFAADRGWDRQLGAEELAFREQAAPAGERPRAGGDKPRGNRRRGGGGSGGFSGGLALIATPARWSLSVPDGRYTVAVTLGDDRAWDGAVVRLEGLPLPLPPRCGPGQSEHKLDVTVADGRLDLALGDGEVKAVRAEKAGVLTVQGHVAVGFRIQDPSWSLGFLAAPEARVIDLLVPQELAPLLAPGRKPGAAEAPLAERLTLEGVVVRRRDGSSIGATVATVGAQNVRNERGDRSWDAGNPADAIAREVRLRPDPAAVGSLVQGASVEVVMTFGMPAGTTALPPHLVRIDRDGAAIRRRTASEDSVVEALRVGTATVVAASIDPRDLQAPAARLGGPLADAQGRFRGEVVPGARTRVSLHWIWGRVESLVEDGSQVQAGDIILSVYNPQMEENRDKSERERRAAVQRVVAAAERRRQDAVRAQAEHAARRVAEATARLRLRRQLDDDPLGRTEQDLTLRQADDTAAAAQAQRQRLAALTMPDANEVAQAEHAVAAAALARAGIALNAAAWELRLDWLERSDLAATWNDTVAALARRDAELAEAAIQERINTLADRLAMERAVEGDWWQRHFASRRNLAAPASGRVLFQTGWNDQTQRSEKIGREFPVWGGMTVAEIVDEQRLRFTTELPEDRFPGLVAGATCDIEFEAAPGRTLPGTISELGRAFLIPRDRLVGDPEDRVSNRRAFSAVISFTPPDDLRRRLSTGSKGWVRLP